jgi:acyl-coenzyme A synthetase/AMP-(fatty) acid ligase
MSDVGKELANAAQAAVDRHITGSQGLQTALRYGDKRYTFHDLAALTNRVGNMLKRLSATAGRFVIVAVPESPAYVSTILGAIKIGAVPVILTAAIDAGTLAKARAAAEAALLIIHQNNVVLLGSDAKSDEVVVVGNDVGAYKSFVDLVREEPSSLQAVRMPGDAAALAWFDGTSMKSIPHRELVATLARKDASSTAPRILAQLHALAGGSEITLG